LNDIIRIPPELALARRLSWRGPFIMGLGLLAAVWILPFWRGPAIMDADVWRHLTAGERIVAVSQFRTMLAELARQLDAISRLQLLDGLRVTVGNSSLPCQMEAAGGKDQSP
jgi:hypothetical protein